MPNKTSSIGDWFGQVDNFRNRSPYVFPPDEARRLYQRFEVHHTPKHASWLNIAECELSALGRQCLARRIEDQPTLQSEVAAWQIERNQRKVRVDWQFTTDDARIELK